MPEDLSTFRDTFDIATNAVFDALGFDLRNAVPRTLTFAGTCAFLVSALECANVSAIITTQSILSEAERRGFVPRKGIALAENPKQAFFDLHATLCERGDFYRRRIGFLRGDGVKIGSGAVVNQDGVFLGDGVVIEDGVVIKPNVEIGASTVLRAGTVVGGKGFQYLRRVDGCLDPVLHSGGVSIGERVEIHAQCAIDRHIFGSDTRIGNDTKFDNKVQFAHGSTIGERCLIAAGAVIAGSVIIGNDVWIGPNATVSDSIRIGDRASVSLGAVVVRDVPIGQRVSGNFAVDHLQFLKQRHLFIR